MSYMGIAQARASCNDWRTSRLPRVLDYLANKYPMQCAVCLVQELPLLGSGAYGRVYNVAGRIAVKVTAHEGDRLMAAWDQWLRRQDMPSPFVPVLEWYAPGTYRACDKHHGHDVYVKPFCKSTGKAYPTLTSAFGSAFGVTLDDLHNNNFANYRPGPGWCSRFLSGVSLTYDAMTSGPGPGHSTQAMADTYLAQLRVTRGTELALDRYNFTLRKDATP